MNILFVHTNFPAQFRHVAAALAKDAKASMVAIGSHTAAPTPGGRPIRYVHPQVDISDMRSRGFDLECRRAEQLLYTLSALTFSGFTPDLIFGHPGWGETLPLQ
jgi:hypothetical protein